MVRPLLTGRKFRASQAGLWIVTKHYRGRSICRAPRLGTSLFGISRLPERTEPTEKCSPAATVGKTYEAEDLRLDFGLGRFAAGRFLPDWFPAGIRSPEHEFAKTVDKVRSQTVVPYEDAQ